MRNLLQYSVKITHTRSCMYSFIVKGQCESLLVVETNSGPEKDRFLVTNCFIHLHGQKSHGLKSAKSGGQATGSFLPSHWHWLGKWLFNHSVTGLIKCGGAPASISCDFFHLEVLPLFAALPTHCFKTRGTVPRLVCLIKHRVQLSGHLRYWPTH